MPTVRPISGNFKVFFLTCLSSVYQIIRYLKYTTTGLLKKALSYKVKRYEKVGWGYTFSVVPRAYEMLGAHAGVTLLS